MSYTTIFKTKPKKDNKSRFCNRISNLLNNIEVVNAVDGNIVLKGKEMLNFMFKYVPLNTGYLDIDDLLKEANANYSNIFNLSSMDDIKISDYELLSNIEIIINCFYNFKSNEYGYGYFWKKDKALKNIEIMFNAIRAFLLSNGLKLVEKDDRLCIMENEIAIDVENIDDEKLKSEIISYYDYKIVNDIEEKKKIIVNLFGKLENRKNDIGKIMGNKIATMLGNYVNNFNLRHINVDKDYRSYYNEKIANMTEEEILEWWNYIFVFMINIYMSLDKLKDVNINDGYK